ncbi:hypothetical protein [Thermoanaerobacterium sp. RBIITD]|uniref:hypothetical protein n=1 Tax=Thermoanaerobacterium sp. RBIITD TaxID=1550240 RepID=UPI000BB8F122|nr:hypothetical protein [Thermoanaerobacterium sp. RBIITD]SNX53500.1 hypothetical protein SAMN05660242_1052 [Thermoanaerobacterium sp. RBIITD]
MKKILVLLILCLTLIFPTTIGFAATDVYKQTNDENKDKNNLISNSLIKPEIQIAYVTEHRTSTWFVNYDLMIRQLNLKIGNLTHIVSYSWDETWEVNAVTGAKIRLVSSTTPKIYDGSYTLNAMAVVDVTKEEIAPDGSYYETVVKILYTEPNTGISYTNIISPTTYATQLPKPST